jgi:hypothetical protein
MATTTRRARKTTPAAPATASDAATVEPAAPDAAPDTDTAATDSTATDSSTTATADTEATVDTADTAPPEAPVSAVPVSAAPVSGSPVSGAPVGSADNMKIVMVAGVLGDHPDGVAAATVADESGLRAAIVGRVLAAMEVAGAAARKPADAASDVELWVRGDGDLTMVDLANAETYHECSCGHRHRVRTAVGTRRASAAPGTNSDGQKKLRKGDLRAIVLDFINSRPGHMFTAYDIAREINRSPGAVINNIEYFLREGLVGYGDADGKKVTALDTTGGGN